jgi:hypothetical protein
MHALLSNNFKIISYENTAARLEETQFGYQSVHYTVKLPDEWLNVPTMTEFRELKAELQVRTLSQHIWAAASHKLQYKQEASVPLPLRRSIHRVSALLETVDIEFERLLEDRAAYVEEIATTDDDQTLNVDLLHKILQAKWPAPNAAKGGSDFSELLRDLAVFEITSTSQLVALIDEQYKKVMTREERAVARAQEQLREVGIAEGTTEERAERGVFFTFTGLTRSALGYQFPDESRSVF